MMSAPTPRTWSMYMALTVPPVPTGMKAGVRISPRGMSITPRRALPSVAKTLKVNGLAIEFLVMDRGRRCLLVERLAIANAGPQFLHFRDQAFAIEGLQIIAHR